MSSTVVTIKVTAMLSFVYLTNRFLDVGGRIDVLIQSFDGYRGVLIFGVLWVVCLAGILATGFLPRLWLRVVFAVPLLAGALVGSAYEDVARTEIDYDQVLMLQEGTSHLLGMVRLHASSVFGAAVLTLIGAMALLFPLRRAGSAVAVVRTATASADRVGGAVGTVRASASPGGRHRLRVLLPAGVAGLSLGRRSRVVLPVAVSLLPFILLPAVIVARGGYGMGGLPIQHKASSLFLVATIAELFADVERKPVDLVFDGREPKAPRAPHVVLVIDAGVRGDYLDLNVQRGTTPALLRHRERIANFGHAVSAANCGPASNLVLSTGAMPADLVNGAQTNPYVWAYARQAGARSVYLHPPRDLAERARFITVAARGEIDEIIVQRGDVPIANDRDVVKVLGELLSRGDSQFIIVTRSEISFPYRLAVPDVRMPFRPPPGWQHPTGVARPAPRASYDDAITWRLDRFFEQLLATVPLNETVLLYTSGHGQSLPEDRGGMRACSTNNPSPLEGLVPMLAITDHPDWRSRFKQAAVWNLNRTSHFNLFATLLVLFGFYPEQVATRFESSLLDSIETEYRFTTGLVTESPRLVIGPRSRLPMHAIPRQLLDRGGRP